MSGEERADRKNDRDAKKRLSTESRTEASIQKITSRQRTATR